MTFRPAQRAEAKPLIGHAKRRARVPVGCANCGKTFLRKASRPSAKFCSFICRCESKRTRTPNDPRPCAACGKMFKPSRYYNARFCSQSCNWFVTHGPEFNARIARESAEQRAAAVRGTGTRGYIKRNGRHEHRVVVEENLGRPLRRGEIVHHIDGNKHNNDLDNLLVMTQREHMREHGLGIPGQRPPWMDKP